ncbi:aquaporin-like protein [Astrocystis sublimbata]|nr:aquaporin-like protein [Astrocystis sublimbata]
MPDKYTSSASGHGHRRHLTPVQADLVAATGEFVGTFWFLFVGYSGQLMAIEQASASGNLHDPTVIYYSALAWISGGFFNPAVTFGLSLAGRLPWRRTMVFIPTQLIGCIAAGAVVKGLFPGNVVQLNTTLAQGVGIAQGLFAEMFFTSFLVFTVLMLAVEKSKDTFLAPIGIGLSLFVAEIPGIYYTGGSLNPARSFGCAVVGPSFPGYHWIYWLGPALGALIAAGYYRFVKALHYEEANPGQDMSNQASEGLSVERRPQRRWEEV